MTDEFQSQSRRYFVEKTSLTSCLWFGAIAINQFGDGILHFCHSFESFTCLSGHSKFLGFFECEFLMFCGLFIELRHLHYCVCSFCQLFSKASGYWVISVLSKKWNCRWFCFYFVPSLWVILCWSKNLSELTPAVNCSGSNLIID